MRLTKTYDEVVADATRLAEEAGPDFKYERKEIPDQDIDMTNGCFYVYNGAPSCIVGNLLNRWGVSLDTLSTYEGLPAFTVVESLSGGRVDRNVLLFLNDLQREQDAGTTWAEALEEAKLSNG